MSLPPVLILAGGVGSRLGDAVASTPKPLLEVAGRPFLAHQLDLLKRNGADEVVISIGYLGEQILSVIGDGRAFGLRITYSPDGPSPLGTAGAVRKAQPLLGDRFMVLYGDTYLRIDYAEVDRRAAASSRMALMTVLRNEGRWDTSNAELVGDRVRYNKQDPDPSMAYIDYGLSVLTRAALDTTHDQGNDLAQVLGRLSDLGELEGYVATERFFEIGTPGSLAETGSFIRDLAIEQPKSD